MEGEEGRRGRGTKGGAEGGRRRKVGVRELEGRKVGGGRRKDGGREERGRRDGGGETGWLR